MSGARPLAGAALVLALFAGGPPLVLALGLATAVGRQVLVRAHERRRQRQARDGIADLAELVALGLAAGHNLHGALRTAGRHTVGELGTEVDAVLRRATHRGLSPALHTADGAAAEFFAAMGRALDRGAPLIDVATAWGSQRRAADHAAAIERIERLPVVLLFPLALLVLPGFMLLLVTPAVVTAIERFGA